MPAEFVHLHVHSEFSLLEGAIRIPQLVDRCKALGMPAVAVTDRGNMFGALQLHRACASAGVKAIVGCEVQIAPPLSDSSASQASGLGSRAHRDPKHLVLLAASQEGYQNLVRIVSSGWVDGFSPHGPHVDFEVLRANRKDVVALSACMAGYLPQEILTKGIDAGRAAMAQLRETFDPGHFFVELEDHGFPENRPLNEVLIELAREQDLPLVATNCCHFLEREQAQAQLVLQCIGAGRMLRDMEAVHHNSAEMYLKSPEQMAELFHYAPEALASTLRIAEMCGGQVNPLSDPQLPRFEVPNDKTEDSYLHELSHAGLQRRLDEDEDEIEEGADEPKRTRYTKRLDSELEVITKMGFSGYFLIVQDFINWAKDHDVPVGPGRGSGAGSLVAWALRITDLDPIPYGLLFERFLNPERVSMPDFDIDFCMDKRDQVIEYVRQQYGHESVGQIATFHQLKSRSVVRDVGRVMGMAPGDAGRIATLIPEPINGKTVSIPQAMQSEMRLKTVYEQDATVKKLIDTAEQLENMTRHAGMHAAGVVISEGPIWNHVPVFCPEPDVFVTQYHKDDVEAAGLVKFDFLGLRTLTVLDIAVRLIDRRTGRSEPFRLDRIPLDDPATFALLQSGETTNVFQLESTGMQNLFKQLRPDCFEDIIAAVALYRPGPMGAGMHTDFVERKHGRKKVEYPDPSLQSILEDTRGVIVYQEQVMQIAQQMAGYSLGGADLLRRAMGKKKESEMAKQKESFITGAIERGHSKEKAEEVFELMAYFAGYGFNKSHSAAYALITYQTAYLKAHFPVEFVCATLSADKEKIDKVVRTVAEARAMGITVLPPDVNQSEIDFTVVYGAPQSSAQTSGEPTLSKRPVCFRGELHDPAEPKIRFGLGAIKGVGAAALDAIFEARAEPATDDNSTDVSADDDRSAEQHGTNEHDTKENDTAGQNLDDNAEVRGGAFADLLDFACRVDLRRVNKSVTEALVQCGAFDSVHVPLNVHRAQAYAAIESAIERGKKRAAERQSGQTNLFGMFEPEPSQTQTRTDVAFPPAQSWDSREQLARERTSLGFYVSGHPLDRYAAEVKRFCTATLDKVGGAERNATVTVAGSVEGYRERNTKTGGRIAFFSLEDPSGRIEVIVRGQHLDREGVREALQSGEPVLVTGRVKHEFDRNASENAEANSKIVLQDVALLAAALAQQTRSVRVRLAVDDTDRTQLTSLKTALEDHPGPCPVSLELLAPGRWRVSLQETGLSVEPSDTLLSKLERLFGDNVCELRR